MDKMNLLLAAMQANKGGVGDAPVSNTPPGDRLTFAQMRAWNKFMDGRNVSRGTRLEDLAAMYSKQKGNIPIDFGALHNEFQVQKGHDEQTATKNRQMWPSKAWSGFRFPELTDQTGKNFGPTNGNGRVENQPPSPPPKPPLDYTEDPPYWVGKKDIGIHPTNGYPYWVDGAGNMNFFSPKWLKDSRFNDVKDKSVYE